MPLTQEDEDTIIEKVKQEPRTIKELSQAIGRSWVTAETYAKKVAENTGLIGIKAFREGSPGAVKVVYYRSPDAATEDERKERLFQEIRNGREKTDFDFLELYQFVPDKEKDAFFEEYEKRDRSSTQNLSRVFGNAEDNVYCFSGNLSFVNVTEDGKKVPEMMANAMERGVNFKIVCRINVATLKNLDKLESLAHKYPGKLEISHSHQPLRGFIVDDRLARFKNEEHIKLYRKEELEKNIRIFYEVTDEEWIGWLRKVFWNIYRTGIDHEMRVEEISKVFRN